MSTDLSRSIRVDPLTVQAWLDRLDHAALPPAGLDHRMSRRFDYRAAAVTLEVAGGQDDGRSYNAVGRNLSREGVGLLTGQFVYPRARCKVTLSDPYGVTQVVDGRIARCRYLVGSGALYEVGIAFERPVDVAVFAPQARRTRVLLVDESETAQLLFTGLLGSDRVELTRVATSDEATELTTMTEFDLLLVDLDTESFDPYALVEELRHNAFVRPIVGLTVQGDLETHARCAAAGCTGYLCKPVSRSALQHLLASLADQPLVSTLAQDPALAPLIDEFVGTLRAKVNDLALALDAQDVYTLADLARGLRANAGSYGFKPISDAAADVHTAAFLDGAQTHLRDAVNRLMDLCLRARPATSPPDAGTCARRPAT